MYKSSTSIECTERKYFLVDERRFFDRTRTDRAAGLAIADIIGLAVSERDAFSDLTVEAGIRSRDGRGGFDFLAGKITASNYGIDQLRQHYADLTENVRSQPLAA